ncbi:hypothetical protein J4558_00880 [Leptolyngbya sp. 15MV]|nr:hypothetical protein J4558_00880 [Leptolyngbya sp. 15MV]
MAERLAGDWRSFCAALAEAGAVLDQGPATALDQAEGLRYLSRLTRTALNMLVDSSDPDFPRVFQLCDDKLKIGADNPDNIYQQFCVRGDRRYRITGTRGTVPYLSLGSKANRYAIDGTMASTGELEFADVALEADGSFEIIAGREREGVNWLPLADDSTIVIIRQTFEDKREQAPATFTVECLDGAPHPSLLTPEAIRAQLAQTAAWVKGTAQTFAGWSEMFMAAPNRIVEHDQGFFQKGGGDPNIWYGHAFYDLAPGDAWEIVFTPPAGTRMWNFQLDNWWMESLDHVHHRVWANSAMVSPEADEQVRLVCADADPGFGHWIDLAGHRSGTALFRWIDAPEHPVPQCRVIRP